MHCYNMELSEQKKLREQRVRQEETEYQAKLNEHAARVAESEKKS